MENEFIPKEVIDSMHAEGVPVYLADRTLIGSADIEGGKITINLPEGEAVQEMMGESLLGISFVYMSSKARETINEERSK